MRELVPSNQGLGFFSKTIFLRHLRPFLKLGLEITRMPILPYGIYENGIFMVFTSMVFMKMKKNVGKS